MKDETLFSAAILRRAYRNTFSTSESHVRLQFEEQLRSFTNAVVSLTLLPVDLLSNSSLKRLAVFLLSFRP